MMSDKCIDEYRILFPDGECFIGEPGELLVVEDTETGKAYVQPETENDEVFMERLKRCKRDKKNYFFEEWEEYEYDEDADY